MSRRFQPKDQHGRNIKMSPVNSNWMFTSQKNKNVLFLQTEDEYKFCYFLEFDARIQSYISQPPKIKYHIDQECHEYTADFLATTFSHGDCYFEVKTESFNLTDHKKNEDKYRSIGFDLNRQGYSFYIIDNFISKNRLLNENMKQLKGYRNLEVNQAYKKAFQEVFLNYGDEPIKLKKLIKNACRLIEGSKEEATFQAYVLISRGIIVFNTHEKFSRDVIVRFADESDINIWNAVPL
ncbi:hypothetical protein [Endozoicomonas euniceicola]|uniref:TnsA endonuclease N-terminal domain-containing protein n=1 Tax=Endozoicomonas euniceicola TaxID=1234143 RepID=A0ABY6H0A3_9GAMM|nr:hypothetical protein [Endozoicomonas euniceicola]UYM17668.1 hypothetical protein NX720_07110 [Endozoicomonas euniceicola]